MAEALEQKKNEIDDRWQEYIGMFPTLPQYYFASMDYPECIGNAERTLQFLELEMKNISAQFIERETELTAKRITEGSKEWTDYSEWRVRALRAQRMKENQIRIIQAWIANNNMRSSVTIEQLEKEVRLLRECVTALLFVLFDKYKSDLGGTFDKLMEPSFLDSPDP